MSSLLGLADYDDSPAQAAGDDAPETAPPAAESAPTVPAAAAPAAAPIGLLTIVDYPLDADEKAEAPNKQDLGVSLDDDAIVRQRKVGGVQVSVVKRAPPRPTVDEEGVASLVAGEGEADTSDGPARAAFVPPDSPTGEVNPKVMEKFKGFVESAKQGNSVNDYIRHAKRFRNPDLLEKLVVYMDVSENGTNYPPELYEPTAFGKEEYYDQLERARQTFEKEQSRKPVRPRSPHPSQPP